MQIVTLSVLKPVLWALVRLIQFQTSLHLSVLVRKGLALVTVADSVRTVAF